MCNTSVPTLLISKGFLFSFILFHIAGCKSDSECPLTQACINRDCVDPCPLERCGINAICNAKNHRAVCSCPPGYRPDPDPHIKCKQYECLTDPECPTTLACRDEKCVDPCKCARYADCSARNHRGICTCQLGYTGDPYGIACTPSECLVSITFSIVELPLTVFCI